MKKNSGYKSTGESPHLHTTLYHCLARHVQKPWTGPANQLHPLMRSFFFFINQAIMRRSATLHHEIAIHRQLHCIDLKLFIYYYQVRWGTVIFASLVRGLASADTTLYRTFFRAVSEELFFSDQLFSPIDNIDPIHLVHSLYQSTA